MKSLALALLVAVGSACPAAASSYLDYLMAADPGTEFPAPVPETYLTWAVDLSAAGVGAVVAHFTVLSPGPAVIPLFQVYPGCSVDTKSRFDASFSLSINGSPVSWDSVGTPDTDICNYHNIADLALDGPSSEFTLTLASATFPAPDGLAHAVFRFGDTLPAIPLPATSLALAGAISALAALRRRGG